MCKTISPMVSTLSLILAAVVSKSWGSRVCSTISRQKALTSNLLCGTEFWGSGRDEAEITEEKRLFTESRQGHSVNEGFGKEFYRKGNSVKRFWPFSESPDSEN